MASRRLLTINIKKKKQQQQQQQLKFNNIVSNVLHALGFIFGLVNKHCKMPSNSVYSFALLKIADICE